MFMSCCGTTVSVIRLSTPKVNPHVASPLTFNFSKQFSATCCRGVRSSLGAARFKISEFGFKFELVQTSEWVTLV